MVDVVVFCSIFVMIFLLLHIFLGRPVIRYVDKLKDEFESGQSKLKESEELIKGLPNPQKAIEDIEKKVREFNDMGVSRRQLPRIIQLLGRSSSEYKINVISIKPREDIKYSGENLPAGVTKVYIEMVISSSYQAIGDYVKALSELPVTFSLENITIEKFSEKAKDKTTGQEAGELLCTLLLSTYMVWEI